MDSGYARNIYGLGEHYMGMYIDYRCLLYFTIIFSIVFLVILLIEQTRTVRLMGTLQGYNFV